MTNVLIAVAVLGILGAVFGLLLAYASKVFAVETDPRQDAIIGVLPGANCGGCGYAGCANYAEAVVKNGAPCNKCAPGGAGVAHKIAGIMGVTAEDSEEMVAFVRCSGGNKASTKYDYSGIDDCGALFASLGNGLHFCVNGCLGHGNCVKACKFDAIHVIDGVAKVDRDACRGCEACKNACPKGMIVMIPKSANYAVPCNNPDKGAVTRKFCEAGCMGCKLCEKKCPNDAVHVEHNLALIDYAKCRQCGLCYEACPRNLIVQFSVPAASAQKAERPVPAEEASAE